MGFARLTDDDEPKGRQIDKIQLVARIAEICAKWHRCD